MSALFIRVCQQNGIFQVCRRIGLVGRSLNTKAMQVTEEHIKNKLLKELPAQHVEVIDQSGGCGASFSALVVSEKFKGQPLLKRHRLVNTVLEEELRNIHAFTQQTLTPEQWEEQKKQGAQ